ncbi:MAG: methyltransferase [Oscillospiraceae bacterium]|nr:methyltransferase [Oscillospiraceae bacterium]
MTELTEIKWKQEPIGNQIFVCVSQEHRFGTDAFLLTDFSRYKQKDLVCEFGTGCGIIALLMQKQKPPAQIYALDIQQQAIEQLRTGIKVSQIAPEKIIPVCTDLKNFQNWEHIPYGQFNLVICNPPYQPCGSGYESDLEAQRIARHGVYCTIEDICRSAVKLLNTGGRLCLCGRPERLPDYICSMREAGIEPKRLQFVSRNAGDLPWLFLLEGKKQAKRFLQMEKPFIMYQDGRLTEQAQRLYQNQEREN